MTLISSYDSLINELKEEKYNDIFYRLISDSSKSETVSIVKDTILIKGKIEFIYNLFDIRFLEENQNKGRFKEIISILENYEQNVMVSNIVNPNIIRVLRKKSWVEIHSYKNNGPVINMVKLNGIINTNSP